MEIIAKNVLDGWKKSLEFIYKNGNDFIDKDNRKCREVLNLILKIQDFKDIKKPIEILNSFKKWIYPPYEELENFILGKKEIPGYYYNYGSRAFNFESLNQVDNFVIPLLKKDKTTRRATIIFYNPKKDSFLFKKEVPGLIMMNFNIRKGKINATTLIRSNDLFFGWPANIYQTFTLLRYISKKLNIPIGTITTISISAHIFEDQFEDIEKILLNNKNYL